jgi:pimeloyl-ACP methyl ester carboxylesterase
MLLFRRAIQIFLLVAGLVAAALIGVALFFYRQLVHPVRQPLWATPEDAGLLYEDVDFPASDGTRLSGWFIKAGPASRGTVVLVHGWPWNRLGESGDHLLGKVSGSKQVDLLRLAHALQGAGYHVLSFDLRNHGTSAASGPVTFGLVEANDVLGALDYLAGREDVDPYRIAAIGFSMGANALLYALSRNAHLQAVVAVQPVSVQLFASRFAADVLGPFGRPVMALVDLMYAQTSGMHLKAIEPLLAAAGSGETPVLYVQGEGDRWGSASNVGHMAALTRHAEGPALVPSDERFGGYQYLVDHPEIALDFLGRHLV